MVEFMIEHSDDFTAFVADDFLLLFVVEGGDCEAAGVIGVTFEVDVSDVGEFGVEGVRDCVGSWEVFFVWGGESPAWKRKYQLVCKSGMSTIWMAVYLSRPCASGHW